MEIKHFIFLITSLTFIQGSFGFTLNNSAAATFKNDRVAVNVANLTCVNIGHTPAELLDLAEEAVDKFWNTVPTSRLELTRGSLQAVSSAYSTDQICSNADTNNCTPNSALAVAGDILIACNSNSTNFSNSGHILAVGAPNNINGDTIQGSLILINDQSSTSFSSLSRDEKVSALAHEIGHAVGLGHSEHQHNLMYYSSISTRNFLGEDDADGITWLYPRRQPVSCLSTANVDHGNPSGFIFSMLLGLMIIPILILSQKSNKNNNLT